MIEQKLDFSYEQKDGFEVAFQFVDYSEETEEEVYFDETYGAWEFGTLGWSMNEDGSYDVT